MSPKSRGRKKTRRRQAAGRTAGAAGHVTGREAADRPEQRRGDPVELFVGYLQDAPSLLTTDDPLVVEFWVSELLGKLRMSVDLEQIPEMLLGLAFAGRGHRQPRPQMLAVLRGLAAVAGPEGRPLAEEAAADLAAQGVAEPPWVDTIGKVTPDRCWLFGDVYGDMDVVVCAFRYRERMHAFSVRIDHFRGSCAVNIGVSREGEQDVARIRERMTAEGWGSRQIPPAEARARLEAAFATTDGMEFPPVTDEFLAGEAFVRARIRALPDEEVELPQRPRYGKQARDAAVAGFLASPQAQAIGDQAAVRYWAELITSCSGRYPMDNPRRVGPGKLAELLLIYVPRTITLPRQARHAMAEVLGAWTAWAAQQQGLSEAATGNLDDELNKISTAFPGMYDNPDHIPSRAYLSDMSDRVADAEEMQAVSRRRSTAVPVPADRVGRDETHRVDAADPAGRRKLLVAEFGDCAWPAGASRREFLAALELVVTQLWEDDPAEVWQAAQRLEDVGVGRHDVLHVLAQAVLDGGGAGGLDREGYRNALAGVPGEQHPRVG